MVSPVAATAASLLTAVSDALSDDLRPVCKVYQTHGIPVIFQCCECDDPESDETANGELSIHFRRLYDADVNLDEVRRVRPCKGGTLAATFRLVLARCRPIINERGEIPEPSVLTEHAEEQYRDLEVLWNALVGMGEVRVDDISADLSDPGTCSVVFADVTMRVCMTPTPVPGSA